MSRDLNSTSRSDYGTDAVAGGSAAKPMIRFNQDHRPLDHGAQSARDTRPMSHEQFQAYDASNYTPTTREAPQYQGTRKSSVKPFEGTSTSRSTYGVSLEKTSPATPLRKFNEESGSSPFSGKAPLEGSTSSKDQFPAYSPSAYIPREPVSPGSPSPYKRPELYSASVRKFDGATTQRSEFVERKPISNSPTYKFNAESVPRPLSYASADSESPRTSSHSKDAYPAYSSEEYSASLAQSRASTMARPQTTPPPIFTPKMDLQTTSRTSFTGSPAQRSQASIKFNEDHNPLGGGAFSPASPKDVLVSSSRSHYQAFPSEAYKGQPTSPTVSGRR